MQTEKGTEACERFVEMMGLKSFFSAFMGKVDHLLRASLSWRMSLRARGGRVVLGSVSNGH